MGGPVVALLLLLLLESFHALGIMEAMLAVVRL